MGRTSIILGVVALLLLGFILFFERGSLSTSEREGRRGRILEGFVRDRVERIEIQRKGVTTVLAREQGDDEAESDLGGGGFRVVSPYTAPADRDAVEDLLGALEFMSPRRSLGEASAEDLAKFGLDKPRYRVRFVVGREQRGFSIGAPASDGSGTYLRTAQDGRAYVVDDALVEALDHEPVDYHTKELHEGVSAYTTEKLSLRDASGEHVLVKRDGLFWLQRPEPVLGSEPALIEIVNALDALRATRFAVAKPENLADYGLHSPSFSLALESKTFDADKKDASSTERLELRAGGACASHADETYVRVDQGPVMCVADAELAKLRKPVEELREKRLLVLDDGAVRDIALRSGKRELRVTQQDDGERRFSLRINGSETQSGKVDDDALSEWLKAMRESVAVGLEDDPTVAAGPTQTRITFGRGEDKPAYEVELGRVQGDRVAVRRAGEKAIAWFDAGVLELTSVSPVRFRKPQLLVEDASAFTELSVQRTGEPTEIVEKRGDGYVLEQPRGVQGTPAERSSVDEIVRLFSKLEAVRFVADAPLPEHGLSEPAYVVKLELAGAKDKPARTHTLRLGAPHDEGRYAQLDSDPAVFVAARALVRQVEAPLVSRSALAVPLEEIDSVEITAAGGAKLKVEATNSGFVLAGGGDEQRAERIARTIATLRAARVTGYGEPSAGAGLAEPELRVRVERRGDAAARVLRVGQPRGAEGTEDVAIRREDLDVGFTIGRSELEPLRP